MASPTAPKSVAQIRLANAMRLFNEFAIVSASMGADRVANVNAEFARRIGIAQAQWSRFKGGRVHIGPKLAVQICVALDKPKGWLDVDHDAAGLSQPLIDDVRPANAQERLAMTLFLQAYRADPESTASRLLGVLKDALVHPVARSSKKST